MKIVAMIPARLGSNRVKQKNLRLLGGKPLVCHVIETALASKVFDAIYLNSESEKFRPIAKKYGIKFYKRDKDLASDTATNDDFLKDFIKKIKCTYLVQINTTSPFLTIKDMRGFIEILKRHDYLITVKEIKAEVLYNLQPLNFNPEDKMPPSQDLTPIYTFTNGLMGWKKKSYFNAYGGTTDKGSCILKGFSTIDIDTEEDFKMAEIIERYLSETDITRVMHDDGVKYCDDKHQNIPCSNIQEIIKAHKDKRSWIYRIVNTENNCASLICQQPGESNRLHYHPTVNEWWYIVDGKWKVTMGKEKFNVEKDNLVFIKKNTWHEIVNIGKTPAIRLAVNKDKERHVYV